MNDRKLPQPPATPAGQPPVVPPGVTRRATPPPPVDIVDLHDAVVALTDDVSDLAVRLLAAEAELRGLVERPTEPDLTAAD